MDGSSNIDWISFATGFLAALLIIFFIRWRRTQRRTNSLSAPPRAAPSATDLSPELRSQILRLKAEGHMIEAIKLTRERTGLDLKASKELVEGVR
jgi:hypothetical protein